MEHLNVMILAGGSGTRLWPLSTPSYPKQFLPLPGGQSMIQETLERVLPLTSAEQVWVVTGRAFGTLVQEHLSSVPVSHILLEPMGRNTAPAIAWAAATIARHDPQAIMAVFSADHVITRTEAFRQAVEFGCELAGQGYLVTWGIKPTGPETGYGYIRFAASLGEGHDLQAFRAERFVEKPNLETARHYLEDGHYVWNSGMFIWKVQTILEELRIHLPELMRKIDEIVTAAGTAREREVLDELWPSLTSISIDYAVLEKTRNLAVIPVEIGWNDVGNWEQYGGLFASNERGIRGVGHHQEIGSQNVFVYNNTARQVYTIGMQDVIVVEMDDKTVICHKDFVQRVKELAEAHHPRNT
jgi:mannose-1-phosphate guanylyltransferase